MINYEKYCEVNRLELFSERSFLMYDMYATGEQEIMKTNKCVPQCQSTFLSFSAIASAPTPCVAAKINKNQEVENTMSNNNNSERNYLSDRLDALFYTKRRDLQKQFHIGEYLGPKTYKELIDWVKHGKYELDTKLTKRIDTRVEEDELDYYGMSDCFYGINWTGRGHKNDVETYNKATDELDKAYNKARDIIKTLEAAEGLKALHKFEEWSYKS